MSVSKNISIPLAHPGPLSPTPPLDNTREAFGGGFKFTESERAYAIKYVQVLLARDHEISATAIGAALHNKVDDSSSIVNSWNLPVGKLPHHSLGSWRTHIGSPSIRDEIDRLRKRAGIVFRKTQEDQKQSEAKQSVPEQDKFEYEPEDPITPTPTLDNESNTDKKMAEEDDLNVVANFFAGNEDENETETVIWARLTSEVLSLYTSPLCLLITGRQRASLQVVGRNSTTCTMKRLWGAMKSCALLSKFDTNILHIN